MKQVYISLLLFLAFTSFASATDRDLIGWSEGADSNDIDADSAMQAPQKQLGVEVLSWEPRIFLYRGLLTDGTFFLIFFSFFFEQSFLCPFIFWCIMLLETEVIVTALLRF